MPTLQICLNASLGRDLVERHVLVDPDIAGQAEHALGDDVAHDLVGAAFDAGAGRAEQHRLEFAGQFRLGCGQSLQGQESLSTTDDAAKAGSPYAENWTI